MFLLYFVTGHPIVAGESLNFHKFKDIFKDNFIKFRDNSRTFGTFMKFQEFSMIKVKVQDFSRSVRTL